eukprot:4837633-Prymnesium_polylepis.1
MCSENESSPKCPGGKFSRTRVSATHVPLQTLGAHFSGHSAPLHGCTCPHRCLDFGYIEPLLGLVPVVPETKDLGIGCGGVLDSRGEVDSREGRRWRRRRWGRRPAAVAAAALG